MSSSTGDQTPIRPFFAANLVTLVAGTIGLALAAYIWFGLPHEREVSSAGLLLFKLLPFVAMLVAIGWLDLAWARQLRIALWALPLGFLGFFCYFVPQILGYAQAKPGVDFPNLYYAILTLVPFIIVLLALSFRLGGGSASGVLRLGFAMLLLQLSGLEDLAYLLLHHIPLPAVWDWASHMTVFLGHAPSRAEALWFIAVHVVLAILVLVTPKRVLAKPFSRLAAARRASGQPDGTR